MRREDLKEEQEMNKIEEKIMKESLIGSKGKCKMKEEKLP